MKWGDKPYHSLDYEMKLRYQEKVYRLSLNGGMTCPNRDGTIGSGGCIFCSEGGSGDFASSDRLTITEQLAQQKAIIRKKVSVRRFIAYFQAYTNTYAPVSYLERIFTEAISDPEVVVLSIATRPDCLPPEVLDLLERLGRIKPVWIELGLQTIHPQTAAYIRRGYELSCFENAVRELRNRHLEVIVHTILGLPGESQSDVLDTISYLNGQDIQGIKLQLLHVLRNTDLGRQYETDPFPVLTMESYIDLVIQCTEHLRPDIVIHRITGDGPASLMIAPLWSIRKRAVLNSLHAEYRRRDSWQGKQYDRIPVLTE